MNTRTTLCNLYLCDVYECLGRYPIGTTEKVRLLQFQEINNLFRVVVRWLSVRHIFNHVRCLPFFLRNRQISVHISYKLLYHCEWGLCSWCLTPLKIKNTSAISDSRLYWWTMPGYPKKTIDLPQVTNKLYHIMLYRVQLSRILCMS
jgi:hypothetical protein